MNQFLPCDAMLVQYMLSSCGRPSVCLSITCRYCTKTAKRKIMQTMPYDSPGNLVFYAKNLCEIPTGSSPMGAPSRGGVGSDRSF